MKLAGRGDVIKELKSNVHRPLHREPHVGIVAQLLILTPTRDVDDVLWTARTVREAILEETTP